MSKNQMSEIAKQIQNGSFTNKNLEKLVMSLQAQLKSVSGKKVYGYLPKEIKESVDRIFSELAETPQIAAMYDKWCELERAKYKTYTQKEKDMSPLVQNNVFKPVKNMIIQTVLKMEFPVADIEIEVPVPDADIPQIIEENSNAQYCLKWSDDYKNACKIIKEKNSGISDFQTAERLLLSKINEGNVLAMFKLGKLYSMEKSGLNDYEKSFEYYQKALQGFLNIEPKAKKIKPYLQYQLGMMYFKGLGTQIDNQKAAEYFEKSAELGNQYAKRLLALEYISGKNFEQNIDKGISLLTDCADSGDAFSCYQLGRLYFLGNDELKKDNEKAMKYLNLSAEQGNEYAQNLLDNQEKFKNEVLADTVFNLFVNLSCCIEDDYNRSQKNMRSLADSSLRRMIRKKKEELGIKEENGHQQV
ncbi:MAG: hypothetical protein K2J47_01445 [Ruminococcus sp.]|nr:hypothetical protein [Ruminococcus sp.]